MNEKKPLFIFQWKYAFFIFVLLSVIETAEAKEVIGRLERVSINHGGLILEAKIDTGAKNSSLNAENYHLSRKAGEIWVKFDVTNPDGKTVTLEKPVVRFVKIKRKEANIQQRPAILLDVCIGKVFKEVEVNLVNRSNFDYQMLIGRSLLRGEFIVDVGKSFTIEPRC
jgi:hypothetical protein